MITGVYQILNKCNNKCYIGSSKNIEARKSVHFSSLRGGYHYNKHLQAAFNKYGEENFEFIVIEMCIENELLKREKHYISAQTQLCYLSIKIASEDLDIAPSSINKVLKGLRDNIKGYVFEYAKKPPQKEKPRE